MIRLKNKFSGKAALNIMGGPSILKNRYDLSRIDKSKYTIFLESKALTPKFLEFGIEPDLFLMFYPEKCQTNSLQHVIYQSFLADIDLSDLLRDEYLGEYRYFKENFDQYFEPWNPKKNIPFKRYRWKLNVKLKNSPFDLLPRLLNTSIITTQSSLQKFNYISDYNKDTYIFEGKHVSDEFSLERYYRTYEADDLLMLNIYNHINSAAIALFPLQFYMGFKKIYFIGMDMSLLGSMEYSAFYTFKSMSHFGKFFDAARQAYCHTFPRGINKGLSRFFGLALNSLSERKFNRFFSNAIYKDLFYDIWGLKGRFMRDRGQFADCKKLFNYGGIEFINIYEPFKYARPVPGARNIGYEDFLNTVSV